MVSIRQGWGSIRAVDPEDDAPAAEAARLRAAQAGDREALEAWVAQHKRPLFALCYGILGHAEDAEDAVQEVFLRALRSLPEFRGEARLRTWLYRIAINLCLNWKRDHRPTEPWDEERFAVRESPGASLSPELAALRNLQMTEALSTLLPRHRAILILKEREGWSVAEIAAAFRWKPKRVEHELSRARRQLAEWRHRTDEGVEP